MNEQSFLHKYDISGYDRPSVTSDVAIFGIRRSAPDSYRRDPGRTLSLLLIRRGEHPFRDCWALPGGFLRRGETIEQCAAREVEEETGVCPVTLMPIRLYTAPDRDPRGWIISQLYASVLADDRMPPVGGDDAAEARWFAVSFDPDGELAYRLTLRGGDVTLSALLRGTPARFGAMDYTVLESGGLAFDHAAMIASALTALRASARDFDVIFDFLPARFTLTDLQRVQETVMNISTLPANFRRKVADLVVPTDESTDGAGHRPAVLYERKR